MQSVVCYFVMMLKLVERRVVSAERGILSRASYQGYKMGLLYEGTCRGLIPWNFSFSVSSHFIRLVPKRTLGQQQRKRQCSEEYNEHGIEFKVTRN